jgi:hypothetical protein
VYETIQRLGLSTEELLNGDAPRQSTKSEEEKPKP